MSDFTFNWALGKRPNDDNGQLIVYIEGEGFPRDYINIITDTLREQGCNVGDAEFVQIDKNKSRLSYNLNQTVNSLDTDYVSRIYGAVYTAIKNVKEENQLRNAVAVQVYGMPGYPDRNIKPVLIVDVEGELSGDELALIRRVLENAGVNSGEQRVNSESPIEGSTIATERQISRFDIDIPRLPGIDPGTGQLIFRAPNAEDVNKLADVVRQNLTSRGRGR